ncbi:uncharacterized protein EI97DRAFT_445749 [Westerdykella ornata]|uniref:Uncharacterized protein n=1 Tax=Westerdykella ornata TaxID=318751 RepID=A0A6A6J851_WESOR|nr:uncharacterized protein EI97DRAFT_445749 [Westerdykella ornata]KAF2272417.1 hypothetical protein EI97DRAFT_445749 [Westerdykella ornata]
MTWESAQQQERRKRRRRGRHVGANKEGRAVPRSMRRARPQHRPINYHLQTDHYQHHQPTSHLHLTRSPLLQSPVDCACVRALLSVAMDSPSAQDALADDTSTSSPQLLSPDQQPESPSSQTNSPTIDPLVSRVAERIAAAINDFKRELDQRDSAWGTAKGSLELSLKTDDSRTYELTIVQDEDGAEYPITVRPSLKDVKSSANGGRDSTARPAAAAGSTAQKRTRRDSDGELEKDFVSRKKRKLEEEGMDASGKRAHTDEVDEDEDIMPLISKEDLEHLLSKLRDEIQDDTAECVNHVQRLLRRFKDEWHERITWEDEHGGPASRQGPMSARGSVGGAGGAPFPSPIAERDDQNTSTNDLIRQEVKLLSSQIKWVEECRRVADSLHDKREENWRTSSASFHDRNRQDREHFQNRMLHESAVQGKMLNEILNEVKAIGLYAQSMKWETPDHLAPRAAYPSVPIPPAFPQAPPPTAATGAGRGRGNQNKR